MKKDDFLIALSVGSALVFAIIRDLMSRKAASRHRTEKRFK